jgi:hypothetical protein
MTPQAVIAQTPTAKKVESNAVSSAAAPQKAVQHPRARAYWGDRFTIRFWLFCFAVMAGMNLIEAVHRMILFLLGTPSSPP